MDGFFPTSTPEDVSHEDLVKSCEDLSNYTVVLNNRLSTANDEVNSLRIKIMNVEGVILDYISENGKLTDELRDIAEYLGMEMTKTIDVSFTVTYNGTAEIPLDVDADEIDWDDEVEFTWNIVGEHMTDLDQDSVDCDARDMY